MTSVVFLCVKHAYNCVVYTAMGADPAEFAANLFFIIMRKCGWIFLEIRYTKDWNNY